MNHKLPRKNLKKIDVRALNAQPSKLRTQKGAQVSTMLPISLATVGSIDCFHDPQRSFDTITMLN